MHPIQRLQTDTRAVLGALLPRGARVALLDFPNHKNAGDHLIFRGEMEYLSSLGIEPAYIADASRYDKADLDHFLGRDGVILVHGGGNFGDRWNEAQEFHNRIVAENHDRRVIQLPQSIEFSAGPALDRVQAIYGSHPDLTLLIRDHEGVDRARRLFPANSVRFCPDMAFGVGMVNAPRPSDVQVVYVRRTDSEAVASSVVRLEDRIRHRVDDWGLAPMENMRWVLYHIPGAIARRVRPLRRMLYPIQVRMYFSITDLNLVSAKRILARGEVVVTDRLHAAILGALMGRKVVAVDNANRKLSAIIGDYLGEFPDVTFAASPSEAQSLVHRLL